MFCELIADSAYGMRESIGMADGKMATMSLIPTHTPPEIPKRVKLRGTINLVTF